MDDLLARASPLQPATVDAVLRVQRTAGNAAAVAWVQRESEVVDGTDAAASANAAWDAADKKWREAMAGWDDAIRNMQVLEERWFVRDLVNAGELDEVKLTDAVFKRRHPKRALQRLDPKKARDRKRIYEWERIRLYIVRRELKAQAALKERVRKQLAAKR